MATTQCVNPAIQLRAALSVGRAKSLAMRCRKKPRDALSVRSKAMIGNRHGSVAPRRLSSRGAFLRNERTHNLLIVAGSLTVLVCAFIDIDGRGVVPLKVYVAAHLAVYAGVLKRPELKRLAFAVPLFLF